MKIVQIKGANGSGKSTIAFQLLELSNDVEYTDYGTILHDLGWVLIGRYVPGKLTSNGCDKMGVVATIKDAIGVAFTNHPGFNILFEGMMISTIKSTFYNFLLELHNVYCDVQPLFVVMDSTPQACLKRLSLRGTKKSNLKIGNIVNKCNLVVRHAKTYDQELVRWFHVDDVELDDMLDTFLELIEEGEGAAVLTYSELICLSDDEVYAMLMVHDDVVDLATIDNMDYGQRRRLLGCYSIAPLRVIRDEVHPIHALEPGAPWSTEWINGNHFRCRVGYRTGTGNELSLLVQLHKYSRYDVPLLTEWEQVALCDDCGGANGGCPGYASRFDNIKPDCDVFYVMTVSMDTVWAIEYASHKNPYMLVSYTDLLTMTYTRRILKALESLGYYTLGISNCPGKCKECAVSVKSAACKKPKRRGYSMEAVGVDCDYLHFELYGEWLPWAYKGHWIIPTYTTRYAGVFVDNPALEYDRNTGMTMMFDLEYTLRQDKSYVDPPELPSLSYPMCAMEIPSGVHKGSAMYIYDLWDKENLWMAK